MKMICKPWSLTRKHMHKRLIDSDGVKSAKIISQDSATLQPQARMPPLTDIWGQEPQNYGEYDASMAGFERRRPVTR